MPSLTKWVNFPLRQIRHDAYEAGVEDWNEVGAAPLWVPFTNSWSNLGSSDQTAAFMKDPFGFVHIKGTVTGGTLTSAIFTLPVGYRPDKNINVPTTSNSVYANLLVSSAGVVRVTATAGSNAYVNLTIPAFRVPVDDTTPHF